MCLLPASKNDSQQQDNDAAKQNKTKQKLALSLTVQKTWWLCINSLKRIK